jgi:CHAD domain-containing protein
MAKAKRVRGIDCNAAAAAGIKLVLITRFKELYSFHEAALNWTDPEGVHSMRVASRRLRSALRDFKPYLRKKGLTSIQKEIRSLADALGKVRDQDVAIMALEKVATHAPTEVLPALEEYIDSRKKVLERAREELKSILEKSELEKLESSFMEGVDKATTTNERELTFRKMSKPIILDRLKELEELSDGLFNPFEIETLHEMRIAAKRLRYALELFQQCWGNSITTYAKRAARIQSALGDVHDCDVWIKNFAKQISAARKDKQNEALAAIVWLLSHFVKLRTKHLREAFDRWCQWEVHDVSAKLRAALHSDGGERAGLTAIAATTNVGSELE